MYCTQKKRSERSLFFPSESSAQLFRVVEVVINREGDNEGSGVVVCRSYGEENEMGKSM